MFYTYFVHTVYKCAQQQKPRTQKRADVCINAVHTCTITMNTYKYTYMPLHKKGIGTNTYLDVFEISNRAIYGASTETSM